MPKTPIPAYEQVKAFIKTRISAGTWKPGDPVPSEAALMTQFGISRMTVNRALRELAAEGMVTRVQGSGTRVAELHRISSRLTIRDIHEEVAERGHVHTTRVLLVEAEKASADLAKTLGLRAGARIFHTLLVHLENGVPIQYEDRYVNPAAAPGFLETDFTRTTPTHHLLLHAPLTEASYSIEACLPTAQEAKQLGIKRSEPCLAMMRRTVSGAHVASVARLVYPGTRYSFAGQFQA
ncbi:MAG: histidine utilization repressor [Pseudomonadota bacterium]|uniref:histidine utilization repressor n=1 Tax=Polaromonas sp. TaxID=1869339 RepID=UPI001823681F|nr:histidine utilization repressor [Polaromonas sp.]MBA3593886.1 histidine utilization repressor [Polaromonas sp.]MDQ3273291.1 histidine utilization repressor [Pseudomonadota bacterium]